MPINLIYSPECLEYREAGHPDSPERVATIADFLGQKKAGRFLLPGKCKEEDLFLVHSEEMVERVRENSLPYDPSTPNIRGIYDYALLSCGAAEEACRLAVGGETSFSLLRPPGHHAGSKRAGGFCYFNSMAVAVKKIPGEKRIAILDIDGHHGNGTEEIFREKEGIIYVSVHQFPAFPGTGSVSFANCYNFPVYPGSSSSTYMKKFMNALSVIAGFSPDLLGISAGFDTHRTDPLLDLPLKDSDYYLMGREISSLNLDTFIVLEGGYNVKTVGNACYCFIKGIGKEKHGQETGKRI